MGSTPKAICTPSPSVWGGHNDSWAARHGGHFLLSTLIWYIQKIKEEAGLNHTIFILINSQGALQFRSLNQRTSGPLNAQLTPGPGVYFNAFIHVYSPRAGADNPLGTNVDVNRKPLSLCPFVASFKTISLQYNFKPLLFPHPTETSYEIWLWLAQRFWRRRSLKMVDRWTTDGRTTDHGYTISSPMSLKAQVS